MKSLLVLCLLVFAGCQASTPTLEAVPPAAWSRVRAGPADRPVEGPARVLASPTAASVVTPPFRATVTRVRVREGDSVDAGAPLVEDFTHLENRLTFEAIVRAALLADKASSNAEAIRAEAQNEVDPVLLPNFERIMSRSEPELYRFALPYELEARLKRLRHYNDLMWNQQCSLMIREAEQSGDKETLDKLLPLWTRSLARYKHYNPKQSTVYRDSRD